MCVCVWGGGGGGGEGWEGGLRFDQIIILTYSGRQAEQTV